MEITMIPKAVPMKIVIPSVLPDVDDPNNYCKSCEKTYAHKYKYREHLKRYTK
jgi:hypothetical protein